MDLTDEETEYTREHYTGEIRKKNLMNCNERELRIRCSFDERYIKTLEKKYTSLKTKYEGLKASLEASRDIDEEFE